MSIWIVTSFSAIRDASPMRTRGRLFAGDFPTCAGRVRAAAVVVMCVVSEPRHSPRSPHDGRWRGPTVRRQNGQMGGQSFASIPQPRRDPKRAAYYLVHSIAYRRFAERRDSIKTEAPDDEPKSEPNAQHQEPNLIGAHTNPQDASQSDQHDAANAGANCAQEERKGMASKVASAIPQLPAPGGLGETPGA